MTFSWNVKEQSMKDYKKYNDELFSRWAPVYDIFELLLSDVCKKIAQAVNPSNKSILDLVTGTGSLAIKPIPFCRLIYWHRGIISIPPTPNKPIQKAPGQTPS